MLVLPTALLSATTVCAQAPVPIPAQSARTAPAIEPSAYCQSGSRAIFQGAGDSELATIQQGCRRCDIIAISGSSQSSMFAIGRLYDFSKAIINTSRQMLYSLSATRGIR